MRSGPGWGVDVGQQRDPIVHRNPHVALNADIGVDRTRQRERSRNESANDRHTKV